MTIDAPESRHPTVTEPRASSNQRDARPSNSTPTSKLVSRVSAALVRHIRRALQRFERFYPVLTRTIGRLADMLRCMGI